MAHTQALGTMYLSHKKKGNKMNNDFEEEQLVDPVYGTPIEPENSTQPNNQEDIYLEQIPEKKKSSVKTIIFTAIIALICGIFIGGAALYIVSTRFSSSPDASSVMDALTEGDSSDSATTKLQTIISIIKTYYYQDVENDALVEGIYKGILESLDDPYSEYYTAEEYDDLMTTLTGNYAGIGALLSKNTTTGIVTITKVYADTPAETAGLMAGDIIEYADDYYSLDEDLDAFVQHIRGEAGTTVTLTILRDEEEMKVEVTRAEIATPTVEYQMLEGNIGAITISQFTSSTYDDFVAAYEDLESQGMESVIFDLRANGGGLLDSVVEIMDYILPEGTIVYTMDKYGNREDFTSDAENYIDIPIVVLVSENTASAAEIFTGAIRDFDYGTIIGTNTFGKGIVQSTIPLTDGSAIKLTTSSYYTPSGECIHGVGIAPDIELEYEFLGDKTNADDLADYKCDNQYLKAIEVLSQE